jgi:histidine ammonia-lyase
MSYRTARASAAAAALLLTGAIASPSVSAQQTYHPIEPTATDRTITLTGRDLTIDQVVDVAREGAKVAVTPQARQRSADRYGLLLEGAAEGMPIYRLNRQAGAGRQIVTFSGSPMTAANQAYLKQRELEGFRRGALAGYGAEVQDEDVVRAAMVVRLNALTYAAVSPQVLQMLVDLLNRRVTPVVRAGGSLGEADLSQMDNIKGSMVGAGYAYYDGKRMSAAAALAAAGLKPVQPFGADNDAFDVTNAFATGQAVLLVADVARALQWADLIDAIDLNAMNSSITPLTSIVQAARPFPWLNRDASRVLDMLRDSYLLRDDPTRIIQDPEDLRAASIRQGSAWKSWAALRDSVTRQINSSDNNPAVAEGSPQDSWELGTPMMMRYYVHGGPLSHGKHGFVFSNANWDPYPLANDIEAFTIALGNLDLAVLLRQQKFGSTFFTQVQAAKILPKVQIGYQNNYSPDDVMQHIQALMDPVAPVGFVTDLENVESMQAQTVMKVERARQALDQSWRLLGFDLITGTRWLDVRKAQDPAREFGAASTAAWTAFRKVLPLRPAGAPLDTQAPPDSSIAYQFLQQHPASEFYSYRN